MKTFKEFLSEQGINERLWYDKIMGAFSKNAYTDDFKEAVKVLHDLIVRKTKQSGGKLRHSIEYYASKIAGSYVNVGGRDLADMYRETFMGEVAESEAPTNVTSGVAAPDAPRFNKSMFAGYPCVEVDAETYVKCSRGKGKEPYARWKNYVPDADMQEFVKTNFNKEKKLLMKNRDTGSMTFIK